MGDPNLPPGCTQADIDEYWECDADELLAELAYEQYIDDRIAGGHPPAVDFSEARRKRELSDKGPMGPSSEAR